MKFFRYIIFGFIFSFLSGHSQSRIYNFTTLPLKDSVRLTFTILQGTTTCAPFEVLRGADSLKLDPIYVYPGICGSTSFNQTYSYTDISPNRVSPNYYQIYIPPGDYSLVKRVDLAASFTNLLIFPQPAEDALSIAISGQKNYYYEITIFDRFGRKKGFGSGNVIDKIALDVSGFPEGVYVFYIFTNTAGNYRGKFLKQPKY